MKKWILLIGLLTYSSVGWSETFIMECPPDQILKHDTRDLSLEKRVNGKWVEGYPEGEGSKCSHKGHPCEVRWTKEIWKGGGRSDFILTSNEELIERDTKFFDFMFPSITFETITVIGNGEQKISTTKTECKRIN